jgi:hypothetical protein
VCWDLPPSDNTSDSDTELTVPLVNDSTEEDEQDADCVHCTGRFSEDRNGEDWIRCAKCFRLAHTLCTGMEEDIGVSFVRNEHCFLLGLYVCICIFFIL